MSAIQRAGGAARSASGLLVNCFSERNGSDGMIGDRVRSDASLVVLDDGCRVGTLADAHVAEDPLLAQLHFAL